MQNIYEQVSQNKLKSNLIVVLFIAFITIAAYLISYSLDLDPSLIYTCFLISIVSSLVSYIYGDKIVLSLNGAKPANRQDYFDFYTVTENLSLASQMAMPKLFVINSPAPNAFTTGTDPKNSTVCATTGLLNKLNRTELEGVIAHELTHIKSYDTRLMTLVSVLIGSLSILVDSTRRIRFDSDDDRKKTSPLQFIGFLLIIFAPLIGKLIQLALSRQREYSADTGAVMLTRQPQGLVSALEKISQDQNVLTQASLATASLYINNPLKKTSFTNLFSTHPPVEDRIKRLNQML